ncbi:MAG TPA: MFS transporter [Actinomycetota bacterium]
MRARHPAAEPMTLRSARFRAIIGMSLLVMTGFGLIVPALPQFATTFDVGEAGVGAVITAFAVTRLVGDLFTGRLLGRFGERSVTAIGVAIVGVSSLAAGAAQSFTQLVVLRGLGGFGSAMFLAGLTATLVGGVAPEARGRAMGTFQAAFGLGFLVGPALGGVIVAVSSPNMPLYVYGIVCLACVPLSLRALGIDRVPASVLSERVELEETVAPPPSATLRGSARLLRHSAFRAAIATGTLTFVVVSAEQTLIPGMWTDRLGASEATSGVPFAVTALASLLVVWHAGSLSDRRGRRFALIPGLGVTAVAVVALGGATSVAAVVVLMAILGAAGGYLRPGPSAMVADVATDETRAMAVAGYRLANDVGSLVGPVLVGTLAEYVSFQSAFLLVAALTVVALAMAVRAEETAPALAS